MTHLYKERLIRYVQEFFVISVEKFNSLNENFLNCQSITVEMIMHGEAPEVFLEIILEILLGFSIWLAK